MREYRIIDDYCWFVKGRSVIDRADYAFCVFQVNTFSNHSGYCTVCVKGSISRVSKYIIAHNNFYIATEELNYYK